MRRNSGKNNKEKDIKMSRKSGVILSYVLMIFEVLSTLLLTPFIIRTLGQAEYGVYKLCASINGYLLLLDLGVGNATIRYIAKYRANGDRLSERKYLGVSTIYYVFIAVLAIAVGVVLITIFPTAFAKGLTTEEIELAQNLLLITMINSAVTLGTAAFNNVIIAYERYDVSKGFSILQIMLRMVLTYLALKAGMGSLGIVYVNLLLTILCRIVFVLFVFLGLKLLPCFRKIEWSFVKDIIMYSSWILLQMIATQINASADQILLGSLVSSSATIIGIYGVGAQIIQYYQSIGSAFNGVLMPGVVRMVEQRTSPEKICDEMIRIGRIIFMVLGLIWICFLFYGKQFIILWAGAENESAYFVTMILMTCDVLYLAEAIGSQVLWAKNEHKEMSIIKILIVVLNVFLTIALIKLNPLIGATMGTFISIMLGDVFAMNFMFKKKIGISLRKYYIGLFKGIIPCLLICAVAGLLASFISINGWIGFILKIGIMCLSFAFSMYKIGMTDYEKRLVRSFVRK